MPKRKYEQNWSDLKELTDRDKKWENIADTALAVMAFTFLLYVLAALIFTY